MSDPVKGPPNIGRRCLKSIKRGGKEFLAGVGDFVVRRSPLPDTPVMAIEDFPWAGALERGFPTIRRELDGVLEYREALPKLHELQRQQYRISSDNKWKAFVLFGWGYASEEGARMCPETTALVKQIPGLRSAFFSILEPGAHIPDHRGHVRGLLRGQLALIVPTDRERCFLRVEDRICHWDEGKMLIFDDTYRHEVRNDTAEQRVVLILHFDRPTDRLGRIVHQGLMGAIRISPFVKKAVANHRRWESRFRSERQQGPADTKT